MLSENIAITMNSLRRMQRIYKSFANSNLCQKQQVIIMKVIFFSMINMNNTINFFLFFFHSSFASWCQGDIINRLHNLLSDIFCSILLVAYNRIKNYDETNEWIMLSEMQSTHIYTKNILYSDCFPMGGIEKSHPPICKQKDLVINLRLSWRNKGRVGCQHNYKVSNAALFVKSVMLHCLSSQ